MRTLVILPGGFAPWRSCLGLSRGLASGNAAGLTSVTIGFAAPWLALAAAKSRVGVTRAGYPALVELPVVLLNLLVPTLVTVVVRWKFL